MLRRTPKWSGPFLASLGKKRSALTKRHTQSYVAQVSGSLSGKLCSKHSHRKSSSACSWLLSPPYSGYPQVTTEQSSMMAANENAVAWICWTCTSCSCTSPLLPPRSGSPQVTTEPSSSMAAKETAVASICWRARAAVEPDCCRPHIQDRPKSPQSRRPG